eukprot:5541761-Prymnesium_polylepis.1
MATRIHGCEELYGHSAPSGQDVVPHIRRTSRHVFPGRWVSTRVCIMLVCSQCEPVPTCHPQ